MVSFHFKKALLQRWSAENTPKKVLRRRWNAEIASRVVVLALRAAPRDPAVADEDPARGKQNREAPERKGKGPKRKYDDLGEGPSDGGGGGAASTSRNPAAPATSRRRRRSADEDAVGGPSNHGDFREEGNDKDEGPGNHGDSREEENDKEPLQALIQEHSEEHIIMEKIKIISQRYEHFRRTTEDSNRCFYRAFLFSYLENLGQLEDRQAEVTRLMKHVAASEKRIRGLKLDDAYFSNPNFSSVMDEFNTVVDSVANGLSPDELFNSCLEATMSPRIISLLRLLTETDIRTRGEEYETLHPENFDAIPYCRKMVRPMNTQASDVAVRALTYALGIPLRVEIVDRRLKGKIVEVQRLDFFPQLEPGKGPDHTVVSYW